MPVNNHQPVHEQFYAEYTAFCSIFFSYFDYCIISLPCCVLLCSVLLSSFLQLFLLSLSTNTLLFSRASQGHCEITYFTDPLSSVTLPTHQTADALTVSLCFCLSRPVAPVSMYFSLSMSLLPFYPHKLKHSQNTKSHTRTTGVYNAATVPNGWCGKSLETKTSSGWTPRQRKQTFIRTNKKSQSASIYVNKNFNTS